MSIEGSESNESQEYEIPIDRTLYFTAGSNIPLKNTLFELQPSLIVMTDLTDFTGQVDMRARYNRMFSFGLGYRWKSGVNVSLGAEFKNFYLGYSYEYPLSAIAKASSGQPRDSGRILAQARFLSKEQEPPPLHTADVTRDRTRKLYAKYTRINMKQTLKTYLRSLPQGSRNLTLLLGGMTLGAFALSSCMASRSSAAGGKVTGVGGSSYTDPPLTAWCSWTVGPGRWGRPPMTACGG